MTDSEIRSEFSRVYSKLNCKAGCKSPANTVSLPFNSIQYNNAGSFYGDALFTRNPITNVTNIQQNQNSGEIGNIILSDDLFGGGNKGAALSYGDSITGSSATLIVGDTQADGGEKISIAFNTTDAVNTISADFHCDTVNGVELSYITGTVVSKVSATPTYSFIHWDDGAGADSIVNVDVNGVTLSPQNGKILIANVPTYADDAAAILGGLTTGRVYKTTTLGSTYLKIVP